MLLESKKISQKILENPFLAVFSWILCVGFVGKCQVFSEKIARERIDAQCRRAEHNVEERERGEVIQRRETGNQRV